MGTSMQFTCASPQAWYCVVGPAAGDDVGCVDGVAVGVAEGTLVGCDVGVADGAAKGDADGNTVGSDVGLALGARVVGVCEG